MTPLTSLTVLDQARRLRQRAQNALRSYDLDVARLRLVSNDFNGIFCVDTRDGRKFIPRVTLPEGGRDLDHVAAEMDWLATLGRETTLSAPRPLPAPDGRLVVEAVAPGVPQARVLMDAHKIP